MIDGTTLRARDGSPGAGIERYTRMISSALVDAAPDRVRVVTPIGRVPFVSRHLAVPLRAALSGTDLLFCPSGRIPLGWTGRAAIVVHDLAIYEHPEWFPKPASRLDMRSIRRAETVFAVSEATKAQIGRLFPEAAAKTVVVYPGGGEAVSGRGRVAAGPTDTILFVGTIEPRKNLANACAAFDGFLRMNPDRAGTTRFVWAGKVGWMFDSILEAVAQTNGVWRTKAGGEVIRLLGYVTDEEKETLYAQASCLLFPSLYEGFGLPVLEALSAGCPVITTHRGALPEVAGDCAMYVEPDNVEQMAFALAQCVLLPEAMGEMVAAGKKRSEAFTWKRAAYGILRALGEN